MSLWGSKRKHDMRDVGSAGTEMNSKSIVAGHRLHEVSAELELLSQMLCLLSADAGEAEEWCEQYPLFQRAMRHNALWKHLYQRKWKSIWGYEAMFENADKRKGIPTDYWYREYQAVEEKAGRDYLLPQELMSMTFSCRPWFHPHPSFRPSDWVARPGVMMSGLHYSESDEICFTPTPANEQGIEADGVLASGRMVGHPGDVVDWFLQHGGRVVNIERSRTTTDRFATFRVCRTSDFGWELQSDALVMRAIDPSAGISNLWSDYTDNLVDEPMPEHVRDQYRSFFFSHREIPNVEALKSRLSWHGAGLE